MKSYLLGLSLVKKFTIVIVAAIVIWGGYRLWFAPQKIKYDLATAVRGTIVQEVSVTGNTAPVKDINLAFESGGTIAVTNFNVGAHVRAGDVIARLNTSDLEAQLAQAKANVDTQIAKLKSLQAGSRPEDIQASQAALAKAKQDLANIYANVADMLSDAYAKTNDAVRNQLSAFFTGGETNNPILTFSVSNSQALNDVQFKRVQASVELNAWQNEIASVSAFSSTLTLENALKQGGAHLSIIQSFLASASQSLIEATALSATMVNTYKTSVTTALSQVNAGITNVSASAQNISSQKIAIDELQAQLNLKLAGSTAEDIAAQQAQVEQAQASVASIQIKIAKASLASPIAGIVTVMDAKAGQIASPGAVLISVISDQGLEVDANISEADIGKVSVNDPATMTLDAFPGKMFNGKVSYIDPGEKIIEGVPTYKTTFTFDNLGPEVKPGMTANIDVVADKRENVIYIPQRAVINKDGQRIVMVYRGAKESLEERKVTVGIRDVNGNIEISSGLAEGEVVVRSPQ
jgi:HlyD family secretion protein